MLDPNFRLNLEGFEERYLHRTSAGCCTHLSAYSPSLHIEIAVLDHYDMGDTTVELMMARPLDMPARRANGRIYTDRHMHYAEFEEFDPLVIRCIAIEWIATYGGNEE